MRSGLAERLFHDLYVLDLEELADLGVDELQHILLASLKVFKELLLTLKVPVYDAVVELNKRHKLSLARNYNRFAYVANIVDNTFNLLGINIFARCPYDDVT